MISSKFGFESVSTPVQNIPQNHAPTPVPSPAPAPVNDEIMKKIVVVRKKNALAASGMIPAEVAEKCLEDFLRKFGLFMSLTGTVWCQRRGTA